MKFASFGDENIYTFVSPGSLRSPGAIRDLSPSGTPEGEGVFMNKSVSHDREEESIEAKARWFQSLSLEERMDLLCSYTNLILSNNPRIAEQKDVRQTKGRIQIVSKP